MHELSAVEALVEALLRSEVARQGELQTVRVRRGSAFSEQALLQGFAAFTRGTPLEAAQLEIEVAELAVACCGPPRTVTADDLVGHMVVCQACGSVRDAAGADELALVSVMVKPAVAEAKPAASPAAHVNSACPAELSDASQARNLKG